MINRETGKLISAKPFVETTWASAVDSLTGRPVINANARYDSGSIYITPSPHGAHSWHAMSYNLITGLVYIPTIHDAAVFSAVGVNITEWQIKPSKGGIAVSLTEPKRMPRTYPGSLEAWNPVTQQLAWILPHKELWNAGTLTTAGNLVFQGTAGGTFLAIDAQSGKIVWTYNAGLGISAPPITYKISGKQYLALLVGWGGAFAGVGNKNLGWDYNHHMRRLIVFALDGKAKVPVQPRPFFPKPLFDSGFVIQETLAEKGKQLYWQCFSCHGSNVEAKGMAPDLRASPIVLSQDAFTKVVRGGAKSSMGMPVFKELSDEDLTAIRHFIRQKAREAKPISEAKTTSF